MATSQAIGASLSPSVSLSQQLKAAQKKKYLFVICLLFTNPSATFSSLGKLLQGAKDGKHLFAKTCTSVVTPHTRGSKG